jgi:long-chain acyl-CoA synthetase
MDKIWLKNYQGNVPAIISVDKYKSLNSLFEEAWEKHQNHKAFVNLGTSITYNEVESLSKKFAGYLQSLNLSKDAKIAIMLPNILQYPIALMGILRAGYIVVNTNPLYTVDEVTHQLKDSEAEVIIVLANFASTIEKARDALPNLKHIIITEIGDLFPTIKRFLVNNIVKYVHGLIPKYNIPHSISFNNAMKIGGSHAFTFVTVSADDIAFLQYTGGTTGISKGAMLTHKNMLANIIQAATWIAPLGIGPEDIVITALPLYHIFSLTANCLTFFKEGAQNILITNPRDINQTIKQIKNVGFTAMTGVNTLFKALLNNKKFANVDFSRLKLALSGGMPLQKVVAEKWQEVTKAPILEAYGLTETSPAVTINPVSLSCFNGSIGLPISSTEISVRDDAGKELAIGEMGELCVSGPQVMKGYWKHEEETKKVFYDDGFLRTGDKVYLNQDGYVFIVDRIKDMILISGFNVYPNEVENVLTQMPGIKEVGVVGIEVDGLETVKACIVKDNPNINAQDVINYAKEHLAAYKVPKIVEFYKELPKTNVGKILRRELR